MNTSEIIEIIDCTPTWEALLLPMLDLYAQNTRYGNVNTPKIQQDLLHEFKNMAQAADKWNEHCKNSK